MGDNECVRLSEMRAADDALVSNAQMWHQFQTKFREDAVLQFGGMPSCNTQGESKVSWVAGAGWSGLGVGAALRCG